MAGYLEQKASVVRRVGGFDIGFSGRCASEDQALGKRFAHRFGHGDRAFVYEPPFAWHATQRDPLSPRIVTNICAAGHRRRRARVRRASAEVCDRCPWFRIVDLDALFETEPLVPFDPDAITVLVEGPCK
jgi:hypothetical protein